MWANRSGLQSQTVKKIGLAWALTLPAAILLSASFFTIGGAMVPGVRPSAPVAASQPAAEMSTLAKAESFIAER
jgi:hypothetical protein